MTFDCRQCHEVNDAGAISRTRGYQVACANCHDAALREQLSEGIDFVSIPSLPQRVVAGAGFGPWPSDATGFLDGQPSPLAQLLIDAASRDESLPADVQARFQLATQSTNSIPKDWSAADPDNQQQLVAAARISLAQRTLLRRFAVGGAPAIQANLPKDLVQQSLFGLSPQLVGSAYRRWFGGDDRLTVAVPENDQVAGNGVSVGGDTGLRMAMQNDDDDLLLQGALLGDGAEDADQMLDDDDALLSGDPLSDSENQEPGIGDALQGDGRFQGDLDQQPADKVPMGGWYRDDLTLAAMNRRQGVNRPCQFCIFCARRQFDHRSQHRIGMPPAAIPDCQRQIVAIPSAHWHFVG
ncbi:MAG: hypothetical protein AAFP69_23810, partial [Planctomycetota bacterium]